MAAGDTDLYGRLSNVLDDFVFCCSASSFTQ